MIDDWLRQRWRGFSFLILFITEPYQIINKQYENIYSFNTC
jgi:hypothetical protein